MELTVSNDTTAFYDAIAEYYPYFYKDWETQLEREGLSLRAIFRNKGVEQVLDASCGAGTQAVALAKLGFQVAAVDPSRGMLAKAQGTAEDYGVNDLVTFHHGDFLNLTEVVDGPFDAIVTKGNALPHLLLDEEIELTIETFYDLLRPGGILVVGMRDFGPFMEARPRFIPGFINQDADNNEFITFDVWEWEDGPPVIATQKLYIVKGKDQDYRAMKRQVTYRPLSTDEVKVVLLEAGFEEPEDKPDRTEHVLVTRKPIGART
jgi:glycine/sarcosine N-methyltransferase